jgi:hypothetical protein
MLHNINHDNGNHHNAGPASMIAADPITSAHLWTAWILRYHGLPAALAFSRPVIIRSGFLSHNKN